VYAGFRLGPRKKLPTDGFLGHGSVEALLHQHRAERNGANRTDGTFPRPLGIPEPLTAERLAGMNLGEAREAFMHFSWAIQQEVGDEDTKKRLWDDWRLVKARFRELKKSDGASP